MQSLWPNSSHLASYPQQTTTLEQLKEPSNQQLTSLGTCGHTGAGKDQCVLSILPVKVKSAKGNHIITTYAFLDPGSSATLCSEQLMQRLNIKGQRTHFLLRTMGQETVVPAYSLTGLEVSGLDSSDSVCFQRYSHRRKCLSQLITW